MDRIASSFENGVGGGSDSVGQVMMMMMQNQKFISVPFVESNLEPKSIKKVLINAVGFGGNAVSVLLSL